VDILRAAATTDRYGNEVRDWNAATVTADVPAWIEPAAQATASTEDTNDRDRLTAQWLLIVAAGTDLTGLDRVVYNGATFEVDGPPRTARNLRGSHHIEARLKVVTG
jgi:hypothetical protein